MVEARTPLTPYATRPLLLHWCLIASSGGRERACATPGLLSTQRGSDGYASQPALCHSARLHSNTEEGHQSAMKTC